MTRYSADVQWWCPACERIIILGLRARAAWCSYRHERTEMSRLSDVAPLQVVMRDE